ncbi:MAG: zinc ABC transporter substrate-binding protein [Candidatus Nitrosocaldus sp.]
MTINNKRGMMVAVVLTTTAAAVVLTILITILQGQGSRDNVTSTIDSSQLSYNASEVKRLRVMTTFYPLYEFARSVVGDRADVDLFIPSGLEPHDWEPSVRDLERLKGYDLFIYNSSAFEPYVDRLKGLDYNIRMVEAVGGLVVSQDPHVWLDPLLAKEQVGIILNAIIDMDEANREYYTKNAEAYMLRLDELHSRFEKELSYCDKRMFITLHAAYNYLASRYGLKQITIAGIEPEHDIPAGKIMEIVDLARRHGIDVVYAEEGVDDRLVRALAEEMNARVLTLSPIEVLDEDDIKQGKTYIAKMEENLENLRLGLGCR